MSETLIDLMRHGEPQGGRRYRGNRIDDPLSDTGWRQMREAAGAGAAWDVVISSPMRRCREFAHTLSQNVEIIDELKEIGFGDWEGRTRSRIQADNPAEYEAFYRDPENATPPGAEPLRDFMRRVGDAYDALLERHRGRHLLVVSHAGVMRAIIGHVLRTEANGLYRMRIEYAGIARIRHGEHGGSLERLNAKMSYI